MQKNKNLIGRNNALLDKWSFVHLLTGILLGWLINPLIALVLMTIWEPFEIFVLSPIMARLGINFGYESLKNSLSDIFVNIIGIGTGAYVLANLVSPPFSLF